MKILAVDDDEFILELLTKMAAKAGFTDIATASSGEAALEMLKDGSCFFDCLLLDISMPDIDGIELCGLARALPAYKITPIIMLTAMTEKDYIDRAFLAGATDYASKPFDIMELHARLRKAESLVAEQRIAAEPGATASGSQLENLHGHTFELTDEIEVEGVSNFINYLALSNYLTQLSNAGIASSQVIAIKIDRIEDIYAKASSEEFLYALTETADAISAALSVHGYMMAYVGNGTFVAVLGKATLEPALTIQTEIQNLLDERDTEYDNGDPLDLEILIGNPLRPSISKDTRVRKTFDRAIARAESRILRKRDEPKPPDIRLIRK